MSQARFIVVGLICSSPVILPLQGLSVQGVVAGIIAAALAIVACTLRPAEKDFLVSVIRPWLAVAAVPALWMLVQVMPLPFLAHPFWASAEGALSHPIAGSISIDRGSSVIALGQYLSMMCLVFVSTAVALDRQRAKWILFALAGAGTAISLIVIVNALVLHDLVFFSSVESQATACEAIGAIGAAAVCLRSVERYEARRMTSDRSISALLRGLAPGVAGLAICGLALGLSATSGTIFACACGVGALLCIWIIRSLRLGPFGTMAVMALALSVVIICVASHPTRHGVGLPLRFAASSTALSERALDDSPLAGDGAGTFGSIAQIYREMDDPAPGRAAPTSAATIAIELGWPMFWLLAAAITIAILLLLRASLRRRRDAFYPAMGGSCLVTLLLLAFVNSGTLEVATSVLGAAAFGVGFAQSQSRSATLAFPD
jgi:hypothetical protein